MKALVYTGTESTEYRDEPEPTPGPNDALIAVDAVGICGSDMHAWHGHDARRVPPLILGHELAGRVLEGDRAGQAVVVNPLIACGTCRYCRAGRTNICPDRELIGLRLPGAFAERVAVPQSNLIALPDGMDPARAALTEPCATAWHGIALATPHLHVSPGDGEALVIGGGSVGLLAALILGHHGWGRVRLAETNALRRSTAAAAGVEVFDPLNAPSGQNGAEADWADLVVDAVGSRATRAAAIAAACPGGVISHIGLQEPGGDFDARTLTLTEITFLGVYTYTPADLEASLAALHAGHLGKLAWIEERPLIDGGQAFVDLDQGATPAAKIILRP